MPATSSKATPKATPKATRRRCCPAYCCANKLSCATACSSLCCLLLVVPVAYSSGQTTYRSIGCLFGWGIATSINSFSESEIEHLYYSRFWLGQSALVVGRKDSTPDTWFYGQRGNQIHLETKMRTASASKWVSATVIHAIVEDPATSLTMASTPGDLLPWWTCSDAADTRCSSSLTLEKLLALRDGLPNPGCVNGVVPSGSTAEDAWVDCAKEMFAMTFEADRFDRFSYGSTGIFLAGLMAITARRAVAGHSTDLWGTLLADYITLPAGITHATYDASAYSSGAFEYDQTSGTRPYMPTFPGLSGSLACSALQYANFSSAFLSGRLVSPAAVANMTASHGSTDGFAIGLEAFSDYGQGMWQNGANGGGLTHSLGFVGFTPWLDQRSADPAEHLFGASSGTRSHLTPHST